MRDEASTTVELLRELHTIADQRRALVLHEVQTVETLREAGASWRLIGDALGVSPQAVQQRYISRAGGRP